MNTSSEHIPSSTAECTPNDIEGQEVYFRISCQRLSDIPLSELSNVEDFKFHRSKN